MRNEYIIRNESICNLLMKYQTNTNVWKRYSINYILKQEKKIRKSPVLFSFYIYCCLLIE
ncbi:hypothetical protein INE89_02200 [Bacteroides thetaiotaomicron]|nr:hypothetical protein INE89_02200 [Bacteroides thetaiotaomicron]